MEKKTGLKNSYLTGLLLGAVILLAGYAIVDYTQQSKVVTTSDTTAVAVDTLVTAKDSVTTDSIK
jgi:hypothetical protein